MVAGPDEFAGLDKACRPPPGPRRGGEDGEVLAAVAAGFGRGFLLPVGTAVRKSRETTRFAAR